MKADFEFTQSNRRCHLCCFRSTTITFTLIFGGSSYTVSFNADIILTNPIFVFIIRIRIQLSLLLTFIVDINHLIFTLFKWMAFLFDMQDCIEFLLLFHLVLVYFLLFLISTMFPWSSSAWTIISETFFPLSWVGEYIYSIRFIDGKLRFGVRGKYSLSGIQKISIRFKDGSLLLAGIVIDEGIQHSPSSKSSIVHL